MSTPLTADGLSTTQEAIWLTDIPATEELTKTAEVAIIGFFQVCAYILLLHLCSDMLCLRVAMAVACWARR